MGEIWGSKSHFWAEIPNITIFLRKLMSVLARKHTNLGLYYYFWDFWWTKWVKFRGQKVISQKILFVLVRNCKKILSFISLLRLLEVKTTQQICACGVQYLLPRWNRSSVKHFFYKTQFFWTVQTYVKILFHRMFTQTVSKYISKYRDIDFLRNLVIFGFQAQKIAFWPPNFTDLAL